MTYFVSVDLRIQTAGYLLYQSIPIGLYALPVTCLLCNLLKKSICIFCPGSVKAGNLIFSVDSNFYFIFLPELMHAVHVLHIFAISFSISDHQALLLCVSIFFEPVCPKCNASVTCLFKPAATTIVSPAKSKLNRSVISLKT